MALPARSALAALEAAAAKKAEAAGAFTAPLAIGRAREVVAEELLRPNLPQRVVIGTGEITDSVGGTSGEVDLILADGNRGVLSFGQIMAPCEAVIAGIEVKSNLAGADIEGAFRKIAAVKARIRKPHKGLYRAGHGDERVPIPPIAPLGFIFAFKGAKWETVLRNARNNQDWFNNDWWRYGPDVIAIAERSFVYKNDRHLMTSDHGAIDDFAIEVPGVPGIEVLLHQVQESLDRYGDLTY